ncbi:hypothetical protein [Actinoplanes sp. N902-109]|uniref:hypothetical protein n=1 Tax=Actinoplanes sp. (strain N902-109) TaxID=649831 RepID=UPI00032958D5|nr:hypothetical protein [Actinoplanes sp. N902-109]AGL16793.1 hypothetical protein L083_3283 [Actinoplanes sp. N902-109]
MHHSAPDQSPSGPVLPDIAAYWPDAPHRMGPAADRYEDPAAEPVRADAGLFTRIAPVPAPAPAGRPAPLAEPPRRRRRTPALLGAGSAVLLLVGAGLVLARRDADPAPPRAAAPPPAATAVPPAASPSPATGSPRSTTTGPAAPPAALEFELVDDTTRLSVRTAALGADKFRVSTPPDAGITARAALTGGVVRLTVGPGGSPGSGRVDVQLSDRVTWRLRMTGGVERASFDMGRGTVSRIDLTGGAATIDLTLDQQRATVPVRMTGGVHEWRIRTGQVAPARVAVRRGAGDVILYDRRRSEIRKGTTLRSGDIAQTPGLDIDAVGGIGTLTIAS